MTREVEETSSQVQVEPYVMDGRDDQNSLMDASAGWCMIGKMSDDPFGSLGERQRDDSSQSPGEAPNDHDTSLALKNKRSCDPVQNHLTNAGQATSHRIVEVQHEDVVVLYHTLVQDGALPPGFEAEFSGLGPHIFPEAQRQTRRLAQLDNVTAAVMLHRHSKRRMQQEQVQKIVTDQFLAAALNKPKVYKTRLQMSYYETTTARRDAEEAERLRWVNELCTLLRGTSTPMGKLLAEKSDAVSLVGAGKRAATLRSRVRMARRFLLWLAVNYKVTFPTSVEQLTDYLKVRVSEPCNRGHTSQHSQGVQLPGRVSRNPVGTINFERYSLCSDLPRVAVQSSSRQADEAGSSHACRTRLGNREVRDGSIKSPIPAHLRMVYRAPELGDVEIL